MRLFPRLRAARAEIADLKDRYWQARVDTAEQTAAAVRLAGRYSRLHTQHEAVQRQLQDATAVGSDAHYVHQLETRLDRLVRTVAALRTETAGCPGHLSLTARLDHLQAVSEAMDLPVGLDITAEQWRTAVTQRAQELAAEQRKTGQAAA